MKDYEIRRKDRAVDENAALEILKSGSFGVLSTIGADGYPYGVPVNYAYDDGKIYFHCAKNVGHKQDNLRFSGKVSFTVVTKSGVISEKFTTGYESAIAFGYASKTVIEKEKALRLLVQKYSPEFTEDGENHIKGAFERTDVFVIEIEKLTAKANKKRRFNKI